MSEDQSDFRGICEPDEVSSSGGVHTGDTAQEKEDQKESGTQNESSAQERASVPFMLDPDKVHLLDCLSRESSVDTSNYADAGDYLVFSDDDDIASCEGYETCEDDAASLDSILDEYGSLGGEEMDDQSLLEGETGTDFEDDGSDASSPEDLEENQAQNSSDKVDDLQEKPIAAEAKSDQELSDLDEDSEISLRQRHALRLSARRLSLPLWVLRGRTNLLEAADTSPTEDFRCDPLICFGFE